MTSFHSSNPIEFPVMIDHFHEHNDVNSAGTCVEDFDEIDYFYYSYV